MAKQDWSSKKSGLFSIFATAVNKKYEDQFDLNDEQVNAQLEDLYDSLPEEWVDSLETNPEETTMQYLKAVQEQQSEEPQYAKKGAKLNYMEKLKKGKSVKKKCKCGCEMEAGGKVCKCCGGGTLQYHKIGGIVKAPKGMFIANIGRNKIAYNTQAKATAAENEFKKLINRTTVTPKVTNYISPIAPRSYTHIPGKNKSPQQVKPTDDTFNPILEHSEIPSTSTTSTQSTTKKNYLSSKGEKAPVNTKVQEWQKKLKAEGFNVGTIDGKWGKKTEAAYNAYMQNRETLKARGSVDDHVSFIEARQGFSRPTTESSQITGTAAQAFYKKGGNIQKKQEGGETWTKSGTGNKSMNPRDWVKSKEEIAFNKKRDNNAAQERMKPKSLKVNAEIVPLKSKDKKDYKKDYIKGVPSEACGGKVKKKLIKKK